MDLESWKSQLRKGAAELAVLSILARGESYGVQLLDRIREDGGLELSDGSIYPLLNRLRKDGKIVARWVEEPEASHPRKYYALSPEGRAFLAEMTEQWRRFVASMDGLMGEKASRV